MEAAPHPWPALGVLLLRDGLVEKAELEEILTEQRDSRQQRVSGRRLGEVLIQRGRVTPTQVAKLVAEQYEIPFLDLDVTAVDVRVAKTMYEDDARRLSALPIGRNGDGTFLLAIADPATVLFSDELRRLLDSVPRFAVVGPDAIERAIAFVFSQPHPTFTIAVEPPLSESADDLIVRPTDEATSVGEPAAGSDTEPSPSWPPLGALLLRDGLVTDEGLETALAQQRLAPSLRLGEILTGKGLVSRGDVARLVAEQYELPFYELERVEIDPEVARRLPEDVAWRLKAVPIAAFDDGSLQVAIADPTGAVYSDDLRQALGVPLTFVVASPDDIEATLDRVHEPTFETSTEDAAELEPDPEQLAEDGHTAERLDVAEPPHLVVEAAAPEVVDLPSEADESWTTRLELVEETAWDVVPEHAEHDVTELPWEPVAEMVPPLQLHTPRAAEADVIELHPADVDRELEVEAEVEVEAETEVVEPETELELEVEAEAGIEDEMQVEATADVEVVVQDEPEARTAEVYEFSWRDAPEEIREEPSLAEELALQVAEAMIADVVAAPVSFDIFGIGSRPPVEPFSDAPGEPAEVESTAVIAIPEHVLEESTEDVTEAEKTPEVELFTETHVPRFETAVADALGAGASTVHFSPRGDELAVRARIDGLMHDLGTATFEERNALVERLESEGIARTRVVETSRGAKTTLFVRERSGASTGLDGLALDSAATTTLRGALDRPGGAILVCGPAGGGTTTTLYALLDVLATPERVVATVEYPVERPVEGVDQVEVAPSSGVTFASAVHDLRLTDTDALIVGDLPDRATADAALRAAYEGRLVVAGFHAPSAATAILRLIDLGVEPAALASSVGWIASQRLVRTVCVDCRETYYATDEELELLGHPATGSPRLLVRGTGCERCGGTGFRGRTAILEVMRVTDELRKLIADGASPKKLQKVAVATGMSLLADEGARLCLDGVTTVSEVVRVLGDGS